jgi:3-hydroxy acid dehydrogenase/malonic semialdehyde reductase
MHQRLIDWPHSSLNSRQNTEFSEVRFHGDKEKAETVYKGFQPLTAEDVADIATFVVNTPDHVNILNLVVLPTAQRSATMVHKETT